MYKCVLCVRMPFILMSIVILQIHPVWMGQFTWWEEMTYREGELSIALREPGTLFVPVAGMRLERKHGWSVELLDIHLVLFIIRSVLQ